MNLTQTVRALATLLSSQEVPPGVEDELLDAGADYARLIARLMIEAEAPMSATLEDFRDDLYAMHPLARCGTLAELTAIAFHLLFDNEWQTERPPLDRTLEVVSSTDLLDDHGMYRVTRWLADLLWSGPESVLPDIDDVDRQIDCAEIALLMATLASKAMPDQHHGLDDYLRCC